MRFKTKDLLVHPQHGIGRVIKLERRQVGEGVSQDYYEIAIPTGTIWVPVEGSSHGLRKVTPKNDLGKYRSVLRGRPKPLAKDNRQLRQEILERMKQSSFQARCEVLRDLSAHGWVKRLNESSDSLMRGVHQMLCQEWSLSVALPIEDATREVDSLLQEGRKAYGTA